MYSTSTTAVQENRKTLTRDTRTLRKNLLVHPRRRLFPFGQENKADFYEKKKSTAIKNIFLYLVLKE